MTIDSTNLPKHVGIIMDGNRRWAVNHGLGPVDGHRQAAKKTILPIVEEAVKLGIPYLTFWAFSTENKKRDTAELKGLFLIFRDALRDGLKTLEKRKIKINILGDINWFPKDIAYAVKALARRTIKNKTLTVSFALNYGGREEILRAIKKIIQKGEKVKDLTEEKFASYLDTVGIPDPDLIIRTGGDQRLSGFLPWQGVYAELYFAKVFFPDFSPLEFKKALVDFQARKRRFGGGTFTDYQKIKKVQTSPVSFG